MNSNVSRRTLLRGAAAACAAATLPGVSTAAARPSKLADVGWCWDGQGINGQWRISIFGAGEGTRWFGLRRCCFMFHPNTAMAMEKLADMEEITCDISKWDYERVDHPTMKNLGAPMRMVHDGRIERKVKEAELVSQLSAKYPNLTGAFDDDLGDKIRAEKITPADYAAVNRAIKSANRKLKHWGVVYTRELNKDRWAGFADLLDVVSLWVWASKDLVNLDRYVDECRAIFPGKPINLGCYLRDFTLLEATPMDLLKRQWEFILKALGDGRIQSYSIISGKFIDLHPEQAIWVRDFIRAN